MTTRTLRAWTIAAAILIATSAPAAAQELASSFDQLRVLVKAGDFLTVTDASGRKIVGSLTELTPTTLAIAARDGQARFAEGDVLTIRQRRTGDLAKGAKWGFAVGGGIGLLGALAIASECDECVGMGLAVAGFYAAAGAGIGVFVAGAQSHHPVIFSRPRTSAGGLTVTPLVAHQRRGVVLSLGF
jgi:hypothetical protein